MPIPITRALVEARCAEALRERDMMLGRHPNGRYSVIDLTKVRKTMLLRELALELGCFDPERETLTDW